MADFTEGLAAFVADGGGDALVFPLDLEDVEAPVFLGATSALTGDDMALETGFGLPPPKKFRISILQ